MPKCLPTSLKKVFCTVYSRVYLCLAKCIFIKLKCINWLEFWFGAPSTNVTTTSIVSTSSKANITLTSTTHKFSKANFITTSTTYKTSSKANQATFLKCKLQWKKVIKRPTIVVWQPWTHGARWKTTCRANFYKYPYSTSVFGKPVWRVTEVML